MKFAFTENLKKNSQMKKPKRINNALLFFFLLCFTVLSQDTFYFSSKPEDMDVIEGSEVLLRCDVSNRQHIVFSWAHNNKPIVPTSRRFQEGSHLHILRVTREEDSGTFSCIATNKTSGYSLVSEAALNIQCKYLGTCIDTSIQPPNFFKYFEESSCDFYCNQIAYMGFFSLYIH